jgi:hypothetical protein
MKLVAKLCLEFIKLIWNKERKKKADFLFFNSTSEKLGRYAFGGAVDCQLVKAIATHSSGGLNKKKELRNDLKNFSNLIAIKNSFFIQSNQRLLSLV